MLESVWRKGNPPTRLVGMQTSIPLWRSAFFIVQLSHPYMTTGETITLTRWTFAGKVMSLLFNMLSRLVITLLPRSKPLLISWLQSQSVVILEPKKIKSAIKDWIVCPPSPIHVFNMPVSGDRAFREIITLSEVMGWVPDPIDQCHYKKRKNQQRSL